MSDKEAKLEKIKQVVKALETAQASEDFQLNKNLTALALVLSRQLVEEIAHG